MVAPETLEVRRAALLLHGLSHAVRERVLAKLGEAHTRRLTPLLDELMRLGVPASIGESILEQELATPLEARSSAADAVPTLLERVPCLAPEAVMSSLQACSPATVAVLFRSGDWPWKAQVLGMMPAGRRAEVAAQMRSGACVLAPAAIAVLLERLCREAEARDVNAPAGSAEDRVAPNSVRASIVAAARARLRRMLAWMQ